MAHYPAPPTVNRVTTRNTSAVTTNVHRVPRAPSRRTRLAALPPSRIPRARYELRAAPCDAPPGSRDRPANVRGHRTSHLHPGRPRSAGGRPHRAPDVSTAHPTGVRGRDPGVQPA